MSPELKAVGEPRFESSPDLHAAVSSQLAHQNLHQTHITKIKLPFCLSHWHLKSVINSDVIEGLEGPPIPCFGHFSPLCAHISPLFNFSLAFKKKPISNSLFLNVPTTIFDHLWYDRRVEGSIVPCFGPFSPLIDQISPLLNCSLSLTGYQPGSA